MSLASPARFATKNLSELRIVHLVQRHGSVTRADLSNITGWNQTKVVRLVADLVNRNILLSEQSGTQNRPGRPSELVQLNPDAGYVLGIEFGRKHFRFVITNAVGQVIFSSEEPPPEPFEGCDITMDKVINLLQGNMQKSRLGWENIHAVGIALHDIVSAEGHWVTHENLSSTPYDVKRYLTKRLNRLVVVEDISRSFAETEHRFGAGKDLADMIYLFLGSHGIGSGIFVNRQMLKSSSGVCGEVGHIVVDEAGALCTCGNRGCFEVMASQDAIIKQFKSLLAQGIQTLWQGEAQISFEQICLLANQGDKAAFMVLHQLSQYVGKALSSTINITGAPNVVIGGELRLAGMGFLADVTSVLRQRVIGILAKDINVQFASLPYYAGAWGVAIQALETAWQEGQFIIHNSHKAAIG